MMQSVQRFLYGPPPEERVRKLQRNLRAQNREIDREINKIDGLIAENEKKIKRLLQKKRGEDAKIIAKPLAKTLRHRNQLVAAQATINSISMTLQHRLAAKKIEGTLVKSTEMLKLSNSLIRIPQFKEFTRQFSNELIKLGLMEDMVNDTLEQDDDLELEEEADEEVEKIIFEITNGKLGEAGKPANTALPSKKENTPEVEEESEDEQEQRRMQEQLDAILKS